MECEGSLRCSQGLASDPVLSYHCTVLLRYNIYCNNCTIIRHKSVQSYSKLPISSYLFPPPAGRYSTNQNTAISIPVVVRSKAWVCCRSIAGIAGSNPAEGMFVYSDDCCVLSGRGLRRFDLSSIGFLPIVVCQSVNVVCQSVNVVCQSVNVVCQSVNVESRGALTLVLSVHGGGVQLGKKVYN